MDQLNHYNQSANPNHSWQPAEPVRVELKRTPPFELSRYLRHGLWSEERTSRALGITGGLRLLATAHVPTFDEALANGETVRQYADFYMVQVVGAGPQPVMIFDGDSFRNSPKNTRNPDGRASGRVLLPVSYVPVMPGSVETIGRSEKYGEYLEQGSTGAAPETLSSKAHFSVSVDKEGITRFTEHSRNGTILDYRPDASEPELQQQKLG